MYFKNKHIALLKRFWPIAYDKNYSNENIHNFYTQIGPIDAKDTNFSEIDDQTAHDLGIDDILSQISVCVSTIGDQILYHMLRTPKTSVKDLEARNNIINTFSTDEDIRSNLQYEISRIGNLKQGNLLSLFNTKNKINKIKLISYCLLSLFSIVLAISLFFTDSTLIPFIFWAFMTNGINMRLSSDYIEELNACEHFRRLLKSAEKISSIKETDCKELNDIISDIQKGYSKVKDFKLLTFFLVPLDWGVLIEFINSVFFCKLISYQLILDKIKSNRETLIDLYYNIGKLDALISVASYRERIQYYCEPNFTSKNNYLNIENVIHPLIIDGVANSIEIDNIGVVITGSNMSGKSTFMRTLASNILLAQTFYTPLCEKYTASIFNIMSSMSISDDINQSKSYYLSECEAILNILKNSNRSIPTFCIIDEIFKGTNPTERIPASKEILKYLSNNNATVVVATHDLEIADNNYLLKYFSESVDEEVGLTFDYTLKDGICSAGNAIKLLKFLQYPDIITENALKTIENKGNFSS